MYAGASFDATVMRIGREADPTPADAWPGLSATPAAATPAPTIAAPVISVRRFTFCCPMDRVLPCSMVWAPRAGSVGGIAHAGPAGSRRKGGGPSRGPGLVEQPSRHR